MGCGCNGQARNKDDVEDGSHVNKISGNNPTEQSLTSFSAGVVPKQAETLEEIKFAKSAFVSHKQGRIHDQYRLGKQIGIGAFGKVLIAAHRQTNAKRAVKMMDKAQINKNKKDAEMFHAEVQILETVDHPNIVKLYEVFEDDRHYYLIQEFCTGGELFDFILAKSRFSEATAAHFMKQVLEAVNYCHRKNIVHRDLKPENLLLESQAEDAALKIIDFGTSALFNPSQKLSQKFGTPYYTAPEILSGKYDEKCDIWSCGVILYIMLCGYPPFNGKTDTEILTKTKSGKFAFPDKEWRNISAEAKDLVTKMLNKNQKLRCSAADAYAHPWIQNFAPKHASIQETTLTSLNNLKNFRTEEKLQQAVLTFIASQLVDQDQTKELKETFRELDTNGDGQLSREELYAGYLKIYGSETAAQEEVDRVLAMADTDGNGFLDYTEFIVASMNKNSLLSKQNLEAAFAAFDTDGSGSISIEELKMMLSGASINDQLLEQLILQVDKDGNGEVDLAEFKEMMLKNF